MELLDGDTCQGNALADRLDEVELNDNASCVRLKYRLVALYSGA